MRRKKDKPEPSDDYKEVADSHVQVFLEAWLIRKKESLRVYAARPNSAKVAYKPGLLEASVQPIENGMVNAWRPIWKAWTTKEEAFKRLQDLLDLGWSLDPKRAVMVVTEFLAWQAVQPKRLQVQAPQAQVAVAPPAVVRTPAAVPPVPPGQAWQAVPLFPIEDVG